ncbi:peptidyl-prolyl cis-trans isomerase B (cyclophilin B) [Rhizobium sp. PP-WC-2G-219]|nr:peptidyl-prolyl cis-trans isomerase B (cyclophilin B) [Rhizobium sp. PP-WC-2G-219]
MTFFKLALAGAVSLAVLTGAAVVQAKDLLTITLKNGPVVIELLPEIAPKHVARIKELAEEGAYDNVAFHRVIPGFMAQTGDVQYGNLEKNFEAGRAGMGGSSKADLPAEFSKTPFKRGTVGMARSQSPDSANSQFFIMFDEGSFLNGQYTVVGQVVSGMENVDKIKKGEGDSGSVTNPDRMISVKVGK